MKIWRTNLINWSPFARRCLGSIGFCMLGSISWSPPTGWTVLWYSIWVCPCSHPPGLPPTIILRTSIPYPYCCGRFQASHVQGTGRQGPKGLQGGQGISITVHIRPYWVLTMPKVACRRCFGVITKTCPLKPIPHADYYIQISPSQFIVAIDELEPIRFSCNRSVCLCYHES